MCLVPPPASRLFVFRLPISGWGYPLERTLKLNGSLNVIVNPLAWCHTHGHDWLHFICSSYPGALRFWLRPLIAVISSSLSLKPAA